METPEQNPTEESPDQSQEGTDVPEGEFGAESSPIEGVEEATEPGTSDDVDDTERP